MTREITFMEAAMEALAEEMRRDEKVFHMSTDAPFPLVEEFGGPLGQGEKQVDSEREVGGGDYTNSRVFCQCAHRGFTVLPPSGAHDQIYSMMRESVKVVRDRGGSGEIDGHVDIVQSLGREPCTARIVVDVEAIRDRTVVGRAELVAQLSHTPIANQ